METIFRIPIDAVMLFLLIALLICILLQILVIRKLRRVADPRSIEDRLISISTSNEFLISSEGRETLSKFVVSEAALASLVEDIASHVAAAESSDTDDRIEFSRLNEKLADDKRGMFRRTRDWFQKPENRSKLAGKVFDKINSLAKSAVPGLK